MRTNQNKNDEEEEQEEEKGDDEWFDAEFSRLTRQIKQIQAKTAAFARFESGEKFNIKVDGDGDGMYFVYFFILFLRRFV